MRDDAGEVCTALLEETPGSSLGFWRRSARWALLTHRRTISATRRRSPRRSGVRPSSLRRRRRPISSVRSADDATDYFEFGHQVIGCEGGTWGSVSIRDATQSSGVGKCGRKALTRGQATADAGAEALSSMSHTPRHCFDVTSSRAVSFNSFATAAAAGDSRLPASE